MFCAFEALCMAKFFDNSGVGLAKVYGFFVGYYPTFFDDLFVQFIVGWTLLQRQNKKRLLATNFVVNKQT